ncbi:nuclease P1 [Xylariomycetidae sp. FL2044]|nr:nuclease P1 [Xylariomycetidae sp. FL2044]
MRAGQFAAVAAALAAPVAAWNKDVHQQIAYTADELLSPWTKIILKQILEPEYQGSLGRVGAWADDYRKTDEGAYTTQWHWIDPADQPPSFCNVHYNRDCTSGGCIISALANQTQILKGCIKDAKLGKLRNGENPDCANAVKFIAHFTSDIAQPLHVSGIAAGGNGFTVTFAGEETNLHSVWDGAIIYSLANVSTFGNETLHPFFSTVAERIRRDNFFVPTSEWVACADPSTPVGCPMAWARDTNEWTCDYVYSQIYNGTDLATSGYAEGAWPIVELQTAKAALRMATWFNRLVDGSYREREVVLTTNPSWLGGPNAGI